MLEFHSMHLILLPIIAQVLTGLLSSVTITCNRLQPQFYFITIFNMIQYDWWVRLGGGKRWTKLIVGFY
jgi:hypothetical protein